jgi:hypothetical protein
MQVGLVAIAATLTGLDAQDCVWEQRSRPFINPIGRAICLMSLGPIATPYSQTDELRTTFDIARPTNTEFRDTAIGLRKMPWRLKVQCFEQTDTENAWVYLERARLRFVWRGTSDALNAIDCGFAQASQVFDLSVPVDEHMTSMAAIDVTLIAKLEETDPTGYGYIQTITGTSTLLPGDPVPYELDLPS